MFTFCRSLLLVVLAGLSLQCVAADLKEVQARGEIRHLGIRYANFVTGNGDGFDVELVQGFARHIGVKYRLVYSDKGSRSLAEDIAETKAMIGNKSLLGMERTCIDPENYGLTGKGLDLRSYTKSSNLNEIVPALLNKEAELTLLDVPDALLDLQKWAGRIKILGPISSEQTLAAAFPKTSPDLRAAFDDYLRKIKSDGSHDKLVDKYFPGIRQFFPEFFAKIR